MIRALGDAVTSEYYAGGYTQIVLRSHAAGQGSAILSHGGSRMLPPVGECDPVIPIAHAIDAAAPVDRAVLTRFAHAVTSRTGSSRSDS